MTLSPALAIFMRLISGIVCISTGYRHCFMLRSSGHVAWKMSSSTKKTVSIRCFLLCADCSYISVCYGVTFPHGYNNDEIWTLTLRRIICGFWLKTSYIWGMFATAKCFMYINACVRKYGDNKCRTLILFNQYACAKCKQTL